MSQFSCVRWGKMLAAFSAMTLIGFGVIGATQSFAEDSWIEFSGVDGPGKGKHVVLVSGDEEYRSEEALPQLAKILARRHGFRCTVLFAIDKNDGTINPDQNDNIPGLESLAKADLLVLFTRFRKLPDDQMARLVEYFESGRPVVALRTSTHAFAPDRGKFVDYTWNSSKWEGGFGRQVLGETWVAHHGGHKTQSTRGIVPENATNHPILRGIRSGDIWGPTDVYTVRLPLPGDSNPLVLGEVVEGMKPTDPPAKGEKNDPMMPVAWTKTYEVTKGKPGRAFTTTMGAATDLESAGTRRLIVNACYWAAGLEAKIPAESNVDLVGEFKPTPFGFGDYVKGRRPADYARE